MTEFHKIKEEVEKKFKDFKIVGEQLTRARNPFELRYFVIGKHDDRVQQYKQAVVEMDAKYQALDNGWYDLQRKDLEKQKLENSFDKEIDPIEKSLLNLEINKLEREQKQIKIGMAGAFKEVMDFIAIIENEYSDLIDKSEEELIIYETDYWKARFAKQIQVDLIAIGRISVGNLAALLSMPKQIQEEVMLKAAERAEEFKRLDSSLTKKLKLKLAESYPYKTSFTALPDYRPLKLLKDAPESYPEDRIVHIDRTEIMIATLHRPGDNVWISEQFYIPTGKNHVKHWITCPSADLIGEYRNRIVLDALSLGCTHLFFVDDDLKVSDGALLKLYEHNLDIVGGWYPKKQPTIESSSIIKKGNTCEPVPLGSSGLKKVDSSLTAGLTLIKTGVFKKLSYPWFLTTERGTEDTYFTQRAIEAGYECWLDTNVIADHIDKETGKRYSFNNRIRTAPTKDAVHV